MFIICLEQECTRGGIAVFMRTCCGGLQMLSSKDVNFVGYTYKNFEIVQDAHVPGVGKLCFGLFMEIVFFVGAFLIPNSCKSTL